jgi:hypothetical protein
MTLPTDPSMPWTAATIERLNARFEVVPDADVGVEDWPAAMSDPSLVEAALAAYDSPEATPDERALIVELLLNTFEFCSIERDGNPDWRGTLDRIERDYDEHAPAVQRWAEPEDGNPWLVSSALKVLSMRKSVRG